MNDLRKTENKKADSKRVTESESVSGYFSDTSRYWEEVYKENERINVFQRMQMQTRKKTAIKYILEQHKGKKLKILDIGSGPGTIIDEELVEKCDIFLIDISMEMLRKAKMKRDAVHGLDLQYVQADVTNVPLKDHTFDIVTGLGLLEYVADEMAAIDEIKRVLKPDGVAILSYPNAIKFGNMLDPYFLLYRIPKYLIVKALKRIRKSTNKSSLYGLNVYFDNRRYILKKLKKTLNGSRYIPIKHFI